MSRLSVLITMSIVCSALSMAQISDTAANTFFKVWNTPFQTPPFAEITTDDYLPAYDEGMKRQKTAIDSIVDNVDAPTFVNTIEALERSSEFLDRVDNVFSALNSSNTNDVMQKIANTTAPLLAKHYDDINLNPKLFARVKVLYDMKDNLNLTPEQKTVLETYYLNFIRGGANLSDEKKEKLRAINEKLSLLGLKFGENLLKETVAIGLLVAEKKDLSGLPADVVKSAAEMAKSKGHDGKWAFTLQKPSFIPFLQYSTQRLLREKLFKAYVNRGNNGNEFDNNVILARIASLRVARAQLLGYRTHADYILEKNMAKKPDAVYTFLKDLWKPAVRRATREVDEMQAIIDREGGKFKLEPWDWWFYAEKLKKEKYALDEEMLRPYFKMENVRQGVFDVAQKLFGIQFIPRKDIQPYHPEVEVFEVKEANGKHIGIFYCDYYPRDSKRSGAWSSAFREQSAMGGQHVAPLVFNVGNFSKPTADKPSLMSVDEVKTLFHEFGHALHSLFSNITYPTARIVPRDFVELPSQVMENWAMDPEVLRSYAKHYETGKPMPDDLIAKIEQSSLFNQGFETVEYLAASFLDMDWHTVADTTIRSTPEFEKSSLTAIGLMPQIVSRYQSTNFQHIFAGGGGYSAGYYSYIWAAVLDADAFQAFKERSLFDQETARSFRTNVLEKGGSEDVMTLYKRFRGAEPKVDALLKRRGLN